MLKVIQIQFSMSASGSAGLRLHNAFNECGINSSILCLKPDIINDESIKYLGKRSNMIAKLDSLLQGFIIRHNIKQFGLFSFPLIGTNVSKMGIVKNADIIYLHWTLMGFLNLSNIKQLLKLKKPVIIIMHDMWHITGGCHHSFSCEKYTSGCFDCQIFPGNKKNDLSTKGFKRKLKLYSKYDNLSFVSPSRWLYDCAKKSLLTKNKPIFYIPNAIDNKLFKPVDKSTARYILNIQSSEIIITFGAVKVDSPYKGWAYLQKALTLLKQDEQFKNTLILIFGGGYNKLIADSIPFNTKFMGYLQDDYSKSLVYNATDVFVVPSLADNQPTTVMESMCCGTPVVGFDVGGIPDMIIHKENGYLAKYKNSEDIVTGIKFCFNEKIKGKILPTFEKREVVKRHFNLINSLRS